MLSGKKILFIAGHASLKREKSCNIVLQFVLMFLWQAHLIRAFFMIGLSGIKKLNKSCASLKG